jgi:hypothetical protein
MIELVEEVWGEAVPFFIGNPGGPLGSDLLYGGRRSRFCCRPALAPPGARRATGNLLAASGGEFTHSFAGKPHGRWIFSHLAHSLA